jgi:PAS domain S-box-containing protein
MHDASYDLVEVRESASEELAHLIGTARTVTTDMLFAVLDQSVDCIKVLGPSGTLDFMNRNGRYAMEIEDFSLVAGRHWWELWPPESRPKVREAVQEARSGRPARFEAFCPTGLGTPRWWDVSVSPILTDRSVVRALVSISRDITDRFRSQELKELAALEMRHRLQNAYTLASALIWSAVRGQKELQPLATEITTKLASLSIAQRLLLEGGQNMSFAQLVRELTEPFRSPVHQLNIGDLPNVQLADEQVKAIALIIGELSTNSSKYGAMVHGGDIAINATADEQALQFEWIERALKPVRRQHRDGGSGLSLIRRTCASLAASVEVVWDTMGLDVRMSMPRALTRQ